MQQSWGEILNDNNAQTAYTALHEKILAYLGMAHHLDTNHVALVRFAIWSLSICIARPVFHAGIPD